MYVGENQCVIGAEEPLPAGGSCLLGSLNLSEFVTNKKFNEIGFCNAVKVAVKGLNDYGFSDTATEIKEFILNMCYNELPYIYENYDTKTQSGKSHNLFSWSSVFIIEFILQFNNN